MATGQIRYLCYIYESHDLSNIYMAAVWQTSGLSNNIKTTESVWKRWKWEENVISFRDVKTFLFITFPKATRATRIENVLRLNWFYLWSLFISIVLFVNSLCTSAWKLTETCLSLSPLKNGRNLNMSGIQRRHSRHEILSLLEIKYVNMSNIDGPNSWSLY